MKLPPLGPECTYLTIRRHSSQITHIRLEGLGGSGSFHIGCCEEELSWLACAWTQMTVASWIWTWTFKISRSTVPSRKRAIQTDFLSLNAFWSRQNMTKHISNSICFQIAQLFVPKRSEKFRCRDFVSYCYAQATWQICVCSRCWCFTNPVLGFPGVRFGTHFLGC